MNCEVDLYTEGKLLHGHGASVKEIIRKGYDAIFMCIAPGLFSDCALKIEFS